MNPYDTGVQQWAFGEPCDYRNGVAFHRLKGPCPLCGTPTFDYGGGWRCLALYCYCNADNPAPTVGAEPDWWFDGTRVFKDGDSWCATRADFVNLQESPVGFGDSPKAAVEALLAEVA